MSSRAEHYIERMKEQSAKNVAKWGEQDRDKLVLVCIEELGELAQAHLQHVDEEGPSQRIIEEAIDLGSVGFQFGVVPNIGAAITDSYKHIVESPDGIDRTIPRMLLAIRLAGLCTNEEIISKRVGEIIVLCAIICSEVEAARC